MKRFYKLLGIAALVAVIAIGLAGCSNDNGGPSGGGGGGDIDTAKLKGEWVREDDRDITLELGDVQNPGTKSAIIDVYYNNRNNPEGFLSGAPGIEGNVIEAGSNSIKVAFEGEKLRVSGATGHFVDADGLYIRQ
jgi:hypothetical protein